MRNSRHLECALQAEAEEWDGECRDLRLSQSMPSRNLGGRASFTQQLR